MAKAKKATKAKKSTKMTANEAMSLILRGLLADTYVLAVKTHGYHWNVTGPAFGALHKVFEEQYDALLESADELAERVRMLGFFPAGSMQAFLRDTVIGEASEKELSANAMLEDILDSYENMRERLIAAENFADDIDDLVTQDMMVGRIAACDKIIWMLRSTLD